jgi:predicted RNA-binding protein with RPS1 domain
MVNNKETRVQPEILDKAINEVFMKEGVKKFARGELKPFLEQTAEKYDISFFSLRNRYYRDSSKTTKTAKKGKIIKKTKDDSKEEKKQQIEQKNEVEVISQNLSQTQTIVGKELVEEESKKEISNVKNNNQNLPRKTHNPFELHEVDQDILLHSQKPAEKFFSSTSKPPYKLHQLVDVKVSNIQSYGAFCEILDGKGFQALCHISQIVDNFIKDVNDYLEVGEIIYKARICLVENEKINISMKHLKLKRKENHSENTEGTDSNEKELPVINNIGERFGDLKDKLMDKVKDSNIVFTNDIKEIEEVFSIEGLTKSQEKMLIKYEKDIEQMTSYLQNGLGALSQQAKLELAKLIEEQGIFNTTRLIMKTQNNFKADLGLMFVEKMKNNVGEYL